MVVVVGEGGGGGGDTMNTPHYLDCALLWVYCSVKVADCETVVLSTNTQQLYLDKAAKNNITTLILTSPCVLCSCMTFNIQKKDSANISMARARAGDVSRLEITVGHGSFF